MTDFSRDDYMFTTEAGVSWFLREEDNGDIVLGSSQDTTPILEHNVALQNASDGWSHDKYMRRIGSVPFGLIEQWKNEDGIDFFNEEAAQEVIRRLNSSEYYKLRTALWNI